MDGQSRESDRSYPASKCFRLASRSEATANVGSTLYRVNAALQSRTLLCRVPRMGAAHASFLLIVDVIPPTIRRWENR